MRFEIVHDTLAKLVFSKASTEAQTRRRIEKFIRDQHQFFVERHVLLTADDLDYIYPHLSAVNIEPDQQRFIDQSIARVRSKRNIRRVAVAATMLSLVVFSVFTTAQLRKTATLLERQKALQRVAESSHATSQVRLLANQDVNLAFRVGRQAYASMSGLALSRSSGPDDLAIEARKGLWEIYYQGRPTRLYYRELKRGASVSKLRFVTGSGGTVLSAHVDTSDVIWDVEVDSNPSWRLASAYEPVTLDQPQKPTDLATAKAHAVCNDPEYGTLSYGRDGQRLIVGCANGVAHILTTDFRTVATLSGHTGNITAAMLTTSGAVTVSTDQTMIVWDLQNRPAAVLQAGVPIKTAVVSDDGRFVASLHSDNVLRLWDVERAQTFYLAYSEVKHRSPVRRVAFAPDSALILTVSGKSNVRLWSLEGDSVGRLTGHSDVVTAAMFDSTGASVVTASRDRTVRIWTRATRKSRVTLNHDHPVRRVAYTKDGRLLALAYTFAYLYDSALKDSAGTRPQTDSYFGVDPSSRYPYEIIDGDISPDGDRFVTVSPWSDGTRLWRLNGDDLCISRPECLSVGRRFEQGQGMQAKARFAPIGRLMFVTKGPYVFLYDVDGTKVDSLFESTGTITDAVFSPDARFVLTGASSGIVRMWGADGREIFWVRAHDAAVSQVAFSPESRFFASASLDSTVRIWPLDPTVIDAKMSHYQIGNITALERIDYLNQNTGALLDKGGALAEMGADDLLKTARLFRGSGKRIEAALMFREVDRMQPNTAGISIDERVQFLGYDSRDFLKSDSPEQLLSAARYFVASDVALGRDPRSSASTKDLFRKATKLAGSDASLTPEEKIGFLDYSGRKFTDEADVEILLRAARTFKGDGRADEAKLLFKSIDERRPDWGALTPDERVEILGYSVLYFLRSESADELREAANYYQKRHQTYVLEGKDDLASESYAATRQILRAIVKLDASLIDGLSMQQQAEYLYTPDEMEALRNVEQVLAISGWMTQSADTTPDTVRSNVEYRRALIKNLEGVLRQRRAKNGVQRALIEESIRALAGGM